MQKTAKYLAEMSPQARFSNKLGLQFHALLPITVLSTCIQNDLICEQPLFALKMCWANAVVLSGFNCLANTVALCPPGPPYLGP